MLKKVDKDKRKTYTNEFICQVILKIRSAASLCNIDVAQKLGADVLSRCA